MEKLIKENRRLKLLIVKLQDEIMRGQEFWLWSGIGIGIIAGAGVAYVVLEILKWF